MKITISGVGVLDIAFDDSAGNTQNNDDTYTFTISTPGGQPCLLNDKEVEQFSFSIVGNFELVEFFSAMEKLRRCVTAVKHHGD